MKTRRTQIAAAERTLAAARLSAILWPWLSARPERIIGVYLALPVELPLEPLFPRLWENGRTLVAPRVDVAAGVMRFWRFDSIDALDLGPWNVREPKAEQELCPEVVLVPGLAYDATGGRLGMGGGWYDRVLENIPLKVGVCFETCVVAQVPREPHDILVDWVVTEKQLRKAIAENDV